MDFILKNYNAIMIVLAVANGYLLVRYWYRVNILREPLKTLFE